MKNRIRYAWKSLSDPDAQMRVRDADARRAEACMVLLEREQPEVSMRVLHIPHPQEPGEYLALLILFVGQIPATTLNPTKN